LLALIYTLHVVICIFLILVVLLQQGSGADLSVFGGGGTQTAFGARSATQVIHRLTVWAFVGFIVTTLAIAFMRGGPRAPSVLSGFDEEAAAGATTEEVVTPESQETAVPEAAGEPVTVSPEASETTQFVEELAPEAVEAPPAPSADAPAATPPPPAGEAPADEAAPLP
jgi:preprotein translocase subunit SecG